MFNIHTQQVIYRTVKKKKKAMNKTERDVNTAYVEDIKLIKLIKRKKNL